MLQEAFQRSLKFQGLLQGISHSRQVYLELNTQHEPQYSFSRILYMWMVNDHLQEPEDKLMPLDALAHDLSGTFVERPRDKFKPHLSKSEAGLAGHLFDTLDAQSQQTYDVSFDSVLACSLACLMLDDDTFTTFTNRLRQRAQEVGNPYISWKHDLVSALSEAERELTESEKAWAEGFSEDDPEVDDPEFDETYEEELDAPSFLEYLRDMLLVHDSDMAFWLAGPLMGLLSLTSQEIIANFIEHQLIISFCENYLATFDPQTIDEFGLEPESITPNTSVELALQILAQRYVEQHEKSGSNPGYFLTLTEFFASVSTMSAWFMSHSPDKDPNYSDVALPPQPSYLTFPVVSESKVDYIDL